MPASRHTFTKDERLRSRKLIEQVISEGKSISVSPFRLSWTITVFNSPFPVQLAIAVPKRFFKRAVDRNYIKRVIREVWRKNKSSVYALLQSKKTQCAFLVIFSGRKVPEYAEVEKKFLLTLQ